MVKMANVNGEKVFKSKNRNFGKPCDLILFPRNDYVGRSNG